MCPGSERQRIGESTLVILGIGNGQSRPYKLVEVSMMDANGKLCQFRAHSVDELKIEVAQYDETKLKIIFPVMATSELRQPQGNIHILIGSDNAQLMPKEICRNNKLILYESVLKGCSQFVIAGQAVESFSPVFAAAAVSHFDPADFLTAESLGTDLPRHCRSCKACKECQFRTTALSAKENAEFDVICNNLKFDEKLKRWSTSYPFIENPSVLRDNYGQAMACMRNLESQLIKQGRLEEFNAAFQDIIDRGVFRRMDAQDFQWEGPVNYISIVCAFKQGPHQSTPLRLCMNSS